MKQNEVVKILSLIKDINLETEKCYSEILQLTKGFAKKYQDLLPKMPYNINIIDELHINENAHSRILINCLDSRIQMVDMKFWNLYFSTSQTTCTVKIFPKSKLHSP